MENILKQKPQDLIEYFDTLNVFAKHHQYKGVEAARKIISDRIREEKQKNSPRDGSEIGIARDEGYDLAMKTVIFMLDEFLSKPKPTAD